MEDEAIYDIGSSLVEGIGRVIYYKISGVDGLDVFKAELDLEIFDGDSLRGRVTAVFNVFDKESESGNSRKLVLDTISYEIEIPRPI